MNTVQTKTITNKLMLRAAVLVVGCGFSVALSAAEHNIRDFGAVGDARTSDRGAIQAAVDACHKDGGGAVMVPQGTFLTGEIMLRSGVTLHLAEGAVLLASEDRADYTEPIALIRAVDAEEIAITGHGAILGRGEKDYGSRYGAPKGGPFRAHTIMLQGCRRVSLQDFTVRYSDQFTVYLINCDTVLVDHVTILNHLKHLNSDGIDPVNCRNVHISNCHVEAGDDGIVIKDAAANIVVSNCTFVSATTGIKFGTGTAGKFRSVHFSNITVKAPTGIGFYMNDGGAIEGVSFSGISLETFEITPQRVRIPIFMDIAKRHANSPVGRIRDVTFRDIHVRSGSGILIQGMPEMPIENVSIDTLTFRVDEAEDYRRRQKAVGGGRSFKDERDTKFARKETYLAVAHVDGVTLRNVKVFQSAAAREAFPRSDYEFFDCRNVVVDGMAR